MRFCGKVTGYADLFLCSPLFFVLVVTLWLKESVACIGG